MRRVADPRRGLFAALAVFLAVAVAVAFLVTGGDGNGPDGGEPDDTGRATPSATAPGEPPARAAPPRPGPDRVVAVKIDNVADARPQSGLDAADVVYVEPVEGGFTRLAAVYSSRLPEVAGPVRSARESDVGLLAPYGNPSLVYSGAAPEIGPILSGAALTPVRPDDAPGAFFRDPGRPVPHNLYVRPAEVPAGRGAGPGRVYEFGPAPAGGTPTGEHTVSYPQARYRLTWSADQGRWLIRLNGTPLESLGAGQVGAATVVVQRVPLVPGAAVEDSTGAVSPVVDAVGEGPATVLRDGHVYRGGWSRPDPASGTRFSTGTGAPLPLAEGPVWVLLVPA